MATTSHLDPKRLGLAAGILWAVCMFLWTLAAVTWGYGIDVLTLMSGVYLGYSVSGAGAFVGAAWGFVDGFVGLYIFAWLYNWLAGRI